MTFSEFLATTPPWLLAALGVLVVLELALDIWALVDLARRPVEQVTLGKKWVWVLVILAVNTIGAIIYLVAGRAPKPAEDVAPSKPAGDRATAAADLLYGDSDKTGTDRR